MKLKVLFVDDEINVIQGLKRMLFSMRNDLDLFFASGGEDALNMLAVEPVDIIISDMRMPGMDGAALLKIVKERYPGIIRIILSGYSENEMVLTASGTAHQYLVKPASAESIKMTITRIASLRNFLNNDHLIQLVSGIDTLPSLPELYIKLENEINSSNASIIKVGEIIGSDITMTAKILQLVNSAFFGLPQRIINPIQAVNFLGFKIIKSLVLYVKIFSAADARWSNTLNSLWNHSLKVAGYSKTIMEKESSVKSVADDAFISGMLHDIGRLIFMQVPFYNENVIKCMKSGNIPLYKAEYEIFGVTHAELGAYLLGIWGLPQNIVEAVAYHHMPEKSLEKTFPLVAGVHIANSFDHNSHFDEEYFRLLGYDIKIDKLDYINDYIKNPI